MPRTDFRSSRHAGDGADAMTGALWRVAAFAVLWSILSEGHAGSWALGVPAVGIATWTSLRLLPLSAWRINVLAVPRFIGFFVWHSMRAGVQVAVLALRGRRALSPALVDLDIALPPGGPTLAMAHILGLMPGTLGVRLVGNRLRVHVLDATRPLRADAAVLEAHLRRLSGLGQ